jgi:hypothetical protein
MTKQSAKVLVLLGISCAGKKSETGYLLLETKEVLCKHNILEPLGFHID